MVDLQYTMDPLTQRLWLRTGLNHAHPLLPPVHNVRVVHLREELTEADIDLHNARVALKKLEAAGPGGDTSELYTAMRKLQEKEQQYFASRYLRSDKAVLRGWKAFPAHLPSDEFVGAGFQGRVYGVIGHPDKVVKKEVPRDQRAYETTLKELKHMKLGSDKAFGPFVHEISADNRVIDLADSGTVPKFKPGMIFYIVMEKVQIFDCDEEMLENYVGIADTWKKMRANGVLSVDCFFAYSPKHKQVVSADFGVVVKASNDTEFAEELYGHLGACESCGTKEVEIAHKYAQTFPTDALTKDILVPVINRMNERAAKRRKRKT